MPVGPSQGRLYAGCTVGLLGGSFNPAHAGHRHISTQAIARLGLDWVWWLVSPQNPLKAGDEMAPLDTRLQIAREVADHPRIAPTAIERDLGTRYTADTLEALTARFPATRFVWLMGADNLAQIPRWRGWTRIFHTVPVAVFDRPTYSFSVLGGRAALRFAAGRLTGPRAARRLAQTAPPAWVFLHVPRHPASATAWRRHHGGPPQTPPVHGSAAAADDGRSGE